MPIKREAYSCQFRCGSRLVVSEKAMLEHEQRCFSNPATKSCKTCAHYSVNLASVIEGGVCTVYFCEAQGASMDKRATGCVLYEQLDSNATGDHD